jgi:hypothetical protein
MHAEQVIITVRYTNGTYVARMKGYKKTASCVYDAGLAAKSLARKLDLDQNSLEMTRNERDYLEFTAKPLRCLPAAWKMAPLMPTIAMSEAGKHALAEGGTIDDVYAAMLEQTQSPEAQPPIGSQGVRQEVLDGYALMPLPAVPGDTASPDQAEQPQRKFSGPGYLEQTGYIPVGSAAEREARARLSAPEQVGTTSDKYRAELYDEVWMKARDMGYGNVTEALVALERVKEQDEQQSTRVEQIMEQAQVFASAWSLVGGPFDTGDGLERAEEEKERLRALLGCEE